MKIRFPYVRLKNISAVLLVLFIWLFALSGVVSAGSSLSIGPTYAKGAGTYDIVVKERRGTKLTLYVNDKNPTRAVVNSRGWATFRRVKLAGTGKISFSRQLKTDGKTIEKPVNYSRLFNIAHGRVGYAKPTPAPSTPVPTPVAPPPTAAVSPRTAPTPPPVPAPVPPPSCANGSYTNSAGVHVCNPSISSSVPAGATARCVDGTYSFSQSRRGTCSHHGGVASWL